LYYPDDLEDRTPHPKVVPQEVTDIIASTYASTSVIENKDAKFTLFPKLPAELRRMIWHRSLPGPRVVEVLFADRYGFCFSPCPIPTALHVNREARDIALESYKACFATLKATSRIYFDMEVDILFFGVGNFAPSGEDPVAHLFQQLLRRDLNQVKNIAIDSEIDTLFSDEVEEYAGLTTLGLKRVESVMVIKNEEGHHDTVLQKSKGRKGEFHAWSVNEEGKISSWHLPQEATSWEGDVSRHWANLEEQAFGEGRSIKTVRLVSLATLERESTWGRRVGYRRSVVYAWDTGCTYQDDGVVKRLVELCNDENIPKYDELTDILNAGRSQWVDPWQVYAAQNHCSCAIGHSLILVLPDVSDISTVDVGAAIAILDDRSAT
jgi:hypothetical protein